jgi:peptidoglycan/LPS O-acetylase OafA/YrhL
MPPAAAAADRKHELPESASLLLDVIRFAAALAVVVGHLNDPPLRAALPGLRISGEYAVPVFFVLSGFVIQYISRRKLRTLREFFVDRASRIYSVALPAMGLTLAAAGLACLVDRNFYLGNFGEVSNHLFVRAAANLLFVSQSWGHNTIPLLNIPFWSLAYECMYYIAFGLIVYLSGVRRVCALLLWLLLAGPQILFLLPIWWLGCWVYDAYYRLRGTRAARILLGAAALWCVLALGGLAFGRDSLALAPFRAVRAFGSIPHPLTLLHLRPVRATMLFFGTGLLAAAMMLVLLLAADLASLRKDTTWARRTRFVAGGTYAIYLMHYPLLVLATVFHLLRPGNFLLNLSTAAAICALLIVVAAWTDSLKDWMRGAFTRPKDTPWMPAPSGLPPASRAGASADRPGSGAAGM